MEFMGDFLMFLMFFFCNFRALEVRMAKDFQNQKMIMTEVLDTMSRIRLLITQKRLVLNFSFVNPEFSTRFPNSEFLSSNFTDFNSKISVRRADPR